MKPVPLSPPTLTVVSRLGSRDVRTSGCRRSKLVGLCALHRVHSVEAETDLHWGTCTRDV